MVVEIEFYDPERANKRGNISRPDECILTILVNNQIPITRIGSHIQHEENTSQLTQAILL